QMDVWWTRSDAIDQRWLTRAWRIYRPATPRTGRRRPGTRPTTDQPLWLGTYIDDDSTLAPLARAERDRLIARHGEGAVETWKMHRGDDKTVRLGHEVVLINAANREDPHGNAKAWPPAMVARVLEGSKSQPPIALLVWTD